MNITPNDNLGEGPINDIITINSDVGCVASGLRPLGPAFFSLEHTVAFSTTRELAVVPNPIKLYTSLFGGLPIIP